VPATPRYRLILLPVDGTAGSERAAAHAGLIAQMSGAAVAILGVIDVSDGFSFSAEGAAMYDRQRATTQTAIEAASAIVRGAGVRRVEHLIMDGIPRTAILEVADEQGADLIVVNAGGAGAEALSRAARCPVLVVPREGR
jgi:nucleotide-binding universal stress UspA family protein